MNSPGKTLGAVAIVLALIAAVGALVYARWTKVIVDADAALAAGQLDQALAGFTAAGARFDRLPVARQLLAAEYRHVEGSELALLYRLGRYDDVIDKAEHAPEGASPHFWTGCALFAKARGETKPDARLSWFTRAEDEFRHAVDATPDDWDAKYDFELTTRLAAALRREPSTPPQQLMQLLRPPTGAKPTRRVG